MGGNELEGGENPLGFVYRATHGEIVYRGVHDNPIWIDEKKPSKCNPFFLQEDAIVSCGLLVHV